MSPYSKAILDHGKALPKKYVAAYDEAMLSTSEKFAKKIKTALAESGITQIALAKKCEVSKQAIQGWLKTGRVDKKHLLTLAEATGKPLSWWLDGQDLDETRRQHPTEDAMGSAWLAKEQRAQYRKPLWPFINITPNEYAQLSEAQKEQAEGFIKFLLTDVIQTKSDSSQRAA